MSGVAAQNKAPRASSRPLNTAERKRKPHKKSRSGCSNCKLRRVKCDESTPSCRKCFEYGVACDFADMTSDLLPLLDVSCPHGAEPASSLFINKAILTVLNETLRVHDQPDPLTGYQLQLSMKDLETLNRFQNRTVQTIGSADGARVCHRAVLSLAASHAYLMHLALSLTLLHSRCVYYPARDAPSSAEAFHRYRAVALFNEALSRPIKPEDRDALWCMAALLGTTSFATGDAHTPQQTWPLASSSSSDLSWLKISSGKKEVFKLTDPTRPDSIFRDLSRVTSFLVEPSTIINTEKNAIPPGFLELFQIDSTSTLENNPYHVPASIISQLMPMICTQSTVLQFLAFCTNLRPEFVELAEQKDPRALLLVGFWFGMICSYKSWWIWHRAYLITQSICLYLRGYHSDDALLQKLVEIPWSMVQRAAPMSENQQLA